MSMTPSEQRGRLLNELQSLQTLLNKTNLMDNDKQNPNGATKEEIIPILKAVHEAAEDVIPTLAEQANQLEPEQATEAENDNSPYLPKDIIERLASQASAISEQIRKMESEGETKVVESQIIEPQAVESKTSKEESDITETEEPQVNRHSADEAQIAEQATYEPPFAELQHESQTDNAETTEVEAMELKPADEQLAETQADTALDTTTKAELIKEEQKQIIINELIEDMLPTLMKQLRARLNSHK